MVCFVAMLEGDGGFAAASLQFPFTAVPPFHTSAPDRRADGPLTFAVRTSRGHDSSRVLWTSGAGAAGVDVVFEGRLDDRASLAGQLEGRHGPARDAASDAELVGRAYLTWGDGVAGHLLGDYAFCVWDRGARRLLCVRDHFGVKPLYYAWNGHTLFVSNVLAALRRAPTVSAALSDRAVGDLLLFGDPQDPGDTLLADVHRVPPGHVLHARPGGAPLVSRYWRFAHPPVARFADVRSYVDGYREVLGRAVRDRLPDGPVAVFMSGGLDSTSLGACAAEHAAASSNLRPRAFTAVYERAFDDAERACSRAAAGALGIPIEHLAVDDYGLFERWDADARPVLPLLEPLTAVTADLLGLASRHAGVALSGEGGDPFLLPATVPRHVGRVPLTDLAGDVWRSVWRYRQRPLFGVRSTLRRVWTPSETPPRWLSARLRRQYPVETRWRDVTAARYNRADLRHESMADARAGWWPSVFESHDAGATRQPIELRYPFFDVRVVSFSLALPSYPWCVDKTILREAMRGRLPEAIRLRPKTPLAGNPWIGPGAWTAQDAVRALDGAPGIDDFVDLPRFRAAAYAALPLPTQPGTLAAVGLALWLTHEAGGAPSDARQEE
jgi:asparagine synthase (glutamine-hydrolysing)